jgi:Flp pilus assembly protein TadD
MIRRLAAVALACAAFAVAFDLRAQEQSDIVIGSGSAVAYAPRDLWPQATAAARDGDFEAADKHVAELVATERTHGIDSFPVYAASAAGLASETEKANSELAGWAAKAAGALDPRSPGVAFSEADRAARKGDWAGAVKFAMRGFGRVFGNYRTNVLSRADLMIVGACAIIVTAIIFAIALFIRYGRSMAHDFREMLSNTFTGGSITVLAFALLLLPVFLWLGPMWLLLYWLMIFFGYAGIGERIAIVVLLLLVAFVPIGLDYTAHRVAGIDSPVLIAAISSNYQSYQPEALRRVQELITAAPDQAALHVLAGNMLVFEGSDDQAGVHYRRAIELRPRYAGAHVNLGNLLFLNNEFAAAITQYEQAENADPDLAVAFYNHSVAAGETYKFDLQAQMLDRARNADRSLVDRLARNPPQQKVVMYNPPIAEAWRIADQLSKRDAVNGQFGNYSRFDVMRSALNPLTLGALLALLLALALWLKRRRNGYANACIKCGRTFCHRCKSARESSTYCTQCIHIYLKRDGVSLDTKRQKLEEVSDHQVAVLRRNRLFTTFLPGSAQLMEGRTLSGTIGFFLFALFVAIAVFVGRLAPALGPAADFAQLLVRAGAIILALIVWFTLSLPVYRRKAV